MVETATPPPARTGLLARPSTHAALAAALIAAALAAYLFVPEVGTWVRQAGNVLRSAEVQGIRMFLHRAGPLEPAAAAALGLYVALVPTLPFGPLVTAAVGRLGLATGTLAVSVGLLAGGTLGFLLSAALLRPLLTLLPGLSRDRFGRVLPWIALAARLPPWIGQGWVSYVTGALPFRLRDHLWTAALGALFATLIGLR